MRMGLLVGIGVVYLGRNYRTRIERKKITEKAEADERAATNLVASAMTTMTTTTTTTTTTTMTTMTTMKTEICILGLATL